ncbi:MAG: Methyltransferase type 11 [Actinomycetia bacterium]|nr:Methyltransferase type 11 [Actinomycetes bacterium]
MANEVGPAARDRLDREASFHDQRYADDPRAASARFYRCSAGRAYFRRRLHELVAAQVVLDCGCGTGNTAVALAEVAAGVTGIDISSVAVTKASQRAARAGARNASFQVMDIEALEFPAATFDVVYGSGVLHHVSLPAASSEIVRVLKPGGRALFLEPLAHNPLVNLYRRMTPRQRSVDEHPLHVRDLRVLRDHFPQVDTSYFDLFTLMPAVITPMHRYLPALQRADAWLFRTVPRAQPLAWVVVVELTAAPA